MANKLPLFTSAPRLELYFGNQKVAYAVGLSLRVSVDLTPVRTFGKYGLASIEPTMYNPVTGTLQIMKLASPAFRGNAINAAKILNSKLVSKTPTSVSFDATTGDATMSATEGEIASSLDGANWTSQKQIMAQLNPGTIIISQTFDAVLYMKTPTFEVPNLDKDNKQVVDAEGKPIKSYSITENAYSSSQPWLKLVDIRIGSRNTNISIGRIVNQPVSFQALLATPVIRNADGGDDNVFSLDTGMGQKQ
jgi:hypothetical protein